MNDIPSSKNNAGSMEARVTKVGEAIGERVQSATAATAAAAGHAQKVAQDAAAAAMAAANQAKTMLGDAGEVAQQAWSQASTVAEDVVDAGSRAAGSLSRQIQANPLLAVLVGAVLGYLAGWWIHGGRAETPAANKAYVKRGKGRDSAPE
jgi:hypothetical protein